MNKIRSFGLIKRTRTTYLLSFHINYNDFKLELNYSPLAFILQDQEKIFHKINTVISLHTQTCEK